VEDDLVLFMKNNSDKYFKKTVPKFARVFEFFSG